MSFEKWAAFCLVMTAIAYTPGPMTMFSMSSSVRNGFIRTIPAIIGGSCAYAIQMVIVYFGLGVVVQNSLVVFNLIKWVGVFYLIILAVKNWQKVDPDLAESSNSTTAPLSRQFGLGMATGLSNPKSILVLTVLFPQFIDLSHYNSQFLILSASFFVIQGSSAIVYGLFGARFFYWMRKRCLTHVQNKVTALILLCAGGILATSHK